MADRRSILRLAGQTAQAAVVRAEASATMLEALGEELRTGNLDKSLSSLGGALDEVHRFLQFLHLAIPLFESVNPSVAGRLRTYWTQLVGQLERLEESLEQADLVAVSLLLEHGIARTLREYRMHAADLASCLSSAARAA